MLHIPNPIVGRHRGVAVLQHLKQLVGEHHFFQVGLPQPVFPCGIKRFNPGRFATANEGVGLHLSHPRIKRIQVGLGIESCAGGERQEPDQKHKLLPDFTKTNIVRDHQDFGRVFSPWSGSSPRQQCHLRDHPLQRGIGQCLWPRPLVLVVLGRFFRPQSA